MTDCGTLAILNVAGGDVKVSFDKGNPQEVIRAARIVKDMLRRGYALLVEVDRDGEKRFERALDFNDQTAEYIIADFDPETAPQKPQAVEEKKEGSKHGESVAEEEMGQEPEAESRPARRGRPRKSIPASGTRAVAVARSAGG